jgi:hypothetical protein
VAKKSRAKMNEELLTGATKPQGWREQFDSDGQSEPAASQKRDTARAGQFRRKTYLMSDDLIARIEKVAREQDVGINEMHRYLVMIALEAVEKGTHQIEIQVVNKRTLGV